MIPIFNSNEKISETINPFVHLFLHLDHINNMNETKAKAGITIIAKIK